MARCVACAGGFCRECITEHEDRLYCGPCFARVVESRRRAAGGARTDWRRWRGAAATAGSLLCLLAGFYLLGRVLAAIPPDFHDGTVWKKEFAR